MEKAERNFFLSWQDMLFLVVCLPVFYVCTHLFLKRIEFPFQFPFYSYCGPSFLITSGFTVLLVALMKSWKIKNTNLGKRLLVLLEAICLAILWPLIYSSRIAFLIAPIAIVQIIYLFYSYMLYLHCVWLYWTVFFGFDIGWLIIMLKWRRIKPHTKVLLTYLVFVWSASLAISPILLEKISGAFH